MVKAILIAVTQEHGLQAIEAVVFEDVEKANDMLEMVADNIRHAGLHGGVSMHWTEWSVRQ